MRAGASKIYTPRLPPDGPVPGTRKFPWETRVRSVPRCPQETRHPSAAFRNGSHPRHGTPRFPRRIPDLLLCPRTTVRHPWPTPPAQAVRHPPTSAGPAASSQANPDGGNPSRSRPPDLPDPGPRRPGPPDLSEKLTVQFAPGWPGPIPDPRPALLLGTLTVPCDPLLNSGSRRPPSRQGKLSPPTPLPSSVRQACKRFRAATVPSRQPLPPETRAPTSLRGTQWFPNVVPPTFCRTLGSRPPTPPPDASRGSVPGCHGSLEDQLASGDPRPPLLRELAGSLLPSLPSPAERRESRPPSLRPDISQASVPGYHYPSRSPLPPEIRATQKLQGTLQFPIAVPPTFCRTQGEPTSNASPGRRSTGVPWLPRSIQVTLHPLRPARMDQSPMPPWHS